MYKNENKRCGQYVYMTADKISYKSKTTSFQK